MQPIKSGLKEREAGLKVFYSNRESLIAFGLTINPSRVLVEDCVQDIYLKLLENQILLSGVKNQEAYLKTCLRRFILKKINSEKASFLDTSNLIEISSPSYEDMLIKQQKSLQEAQKIRKAFALLSPSQKTILTMRFYRSMDYKDIAEKLGVTNRTVYNQVHDAIKKMRLSKLF